MISREIARNGGRLAYRAAPAQERAAAGRARPKDRVLAVNGALRDSVRDGLCKKWSPQQVSRRLRLGIPGRDARRVSHETIDQTLYL